jgi:hypothetical protein
VTPFRVKDQLRQRRADYVQCGLYKPIAVRDGRPRHARRHYDCVAINDAIHRLQVCASGVDRVRR